MLKPKFTAVVAQLESAHLDWYGLRTQLILGLVAIFCLCLSNYLPFWQKNLLIASNTFVPATLRSSAGIAMGLLDFGLYFSSCLLVALITLEITGRFGNRIGANCAIWASLLFCVFPWQVVASYPTTRSGYLVSFLVLLSVFLLLRAEHDRARCWALLLLACALCFGAQSEPHYGAKALIYLFSPDAANNDPLPISSMIGRLLFPAMGDFRHELYFHILELGYLVAGLVLSVRILGSTLKWKALSIIALCMISICLLSAPIWHYSIWITLASAALAITISFVCLPGLDGAPIRTNRLIGCMGLVALIMLTISYEQLFLSYQAQILKWTNIGIQTLNFFKNPSSEN